MSSTLPKSDTETSTAAKLVNEGGVVTLENVRIDDDEEDEAMSSESEVEVVRHLPPAAADQKRIDEVGKI